MPVEAIEIIDKRNPNSKQSRTILGMAEGKKIFIPWTILVNQVNVVLTPGIQKEFGSFTPKHFFFFPVAAVKDIM